MLTLVLPTMTVVSADAASVAVGDGECHGPARHVRGDAAPSQGEDDALSLASKIYMKDARQHLQSLSNSGNTLAKVGEIPR